MADQQDNLKNAVYALRQLNGIAYDRQLLMPWQPYDIQAMTYEITERFTIPSLEYLADAPVIVVLDKEFLKGYLGAHELTDEQWRDLAGDIVNNVYCEEGTWERVKIAVHTWLQENYIDDATASDGSSDPDSQPAV